MEEREKWETDEVKESFWQKAVCTDVLSVCLSVILSVTLKLCICYKQPSQPHRDLYNTIILIYFHLVKHTLLLLFILKVHTNLVLFYFIFN